MQADFARTEALLAALDREAEVREQAEIKKAAQSAEAQQQNALPISDAQMNANRANAQHSTGPTTEAGKATSSKNALKHGLTSKATLLPNEDPDQYQHDLDVHIEIHKPATDEELRLVQTIVDCHWRLDRIGNLETAILLKGHLELANKYEDQPEMHRGRLIHADAYLKYERQIRNLNIQEARLRRTMEKTQAELKNLKAIRRQREMAEMQAQRHAEQASESQPNGFDFSSRPNSAPGNSIPNRHLRKKAA